jgi:hypothetical protein
MPFHDGIYFGRLSGELFRSPKNIGTLADARIALHFLWRSGRQTLSPECF